MAKTRPDQLLVERGLAESRTRAQALILAGLVFSGDKRIDKPGQPIAPDAPLEVKGRDHPWVSRGGHGGDGCRIIDRRLYRRAADAWGDARLCGG
jgi:predicted rRNA methylase YqxC with S4 and FtsJ domains